MGREVMYRRSFHLDGDYKGLETMLELDRHVALRRASADGGFEAPRNSLDVPFSGLLEISRHGEASCGEIVIGHGLSRSLTTRQRGGELSNLKSNDIDDLKAKCKSNRALEPAQKPRTPSIVARLMGLDALPHHENLQCPDQSPSRRALPQGSIAVLCRKDPTPVLASDKYGNTEDEKICYGELPFRNHPQEKQLQDFKRDFTAQQAFQGRHLLSNSYDPPNAVQENKKKVPDCAQQELNMDSQECLDALDFLNANKEFFGRILNEPNSLFTKYLQHPCHPNLTTRYEDGLKGTRLTRSVSRSKKESYSSFFLADGSAESSKLEMQQHKPNEKVRTICSFPWGPDEEMPGHPGSHARARVMGVDDDRVPTRIVVLKPNLDKRGIGKLSSPLSPLSCTESFTKRTEGKENVKQDVKNRNGSMAGASEDFLNDSIKDGLRDARDIARQTVKRMKEDRSQWLLNDGSHISEPLVSSIGRCHRDAGSSRRDNLRPYSSLPSSPHLCRSGRRNDNGHFGSSMKRGEEVQSSSYVALMPVKSSKGTSKADRQAQASEYIWSKQTAIRDPKNAARGRNPDQMNSSKAREFGVEIPEVLPRSLSALAAPSMDNPEFACEKKEEMTSSRGPKCASKASAAEGSPFKERLLSLKDSILITKSKSSKNLSTSHCSSHPDSSELSTPRQLDVVNVLSTIEIHDSSPTLVTYGWPIALIMKDGDAKEADMKNGVCDVFSDNSPRMQTPTGLLHWVGFSDGPSETSLDKCEQPSPVSVLETPFQEESTSSLDTRGTDSKYHDLEHEHSCLEPDYRELPRNSQSLFFSQPSAWQSSLDFSSNGSSSIRSLFNDSLESFSICDVTCPLVNEEELTYIRHILSLSGFTIHGLVITHALSPEHGLKPLIFDRLEAYYAERSASPSHNFQPPLDALYRRLLFDVVNKIVFLKLRKYVLQPWARLTNNSAPPMCSGRQLLEDVVAELSLHRFSPSEGEDQQAAARDLLKEDAWLPSQLNMQAVAMELERLLCGDLIRELVHESVRK